MTQIACFLHSILIITMTVHAWEEQKITLKTDDDYKDT